MLTRSAILATTLAIGLVGVVGSSALAVAFVPGNESGSTQDVPAIAIADQDPAVGTSSAFLAGVPVIVTLPAPVAIDGLSDEAQPATESVVETVPTEPAPTPSASEGPSSSEGSGNGNSGNSNGNSNSGHGNGNSGNGNGNSGNGNGNSGNGSSGNGNGNSGSGNSGNGNSGNSNGNSGQSAEDKSKKDKEDKAKKDKAKKNAENPVDDSAE